MEQETFQVWLDHSGLVSCWPVMRLVTIDFQLEPGCPGRILRAHLVPIPFLQMRELRLKRPRGFPKACSWRVAKGRG